MATINTATHTIEEGPGYILATDKVTGKKSKMAIDLRGMNDSSRKALYELRLRKDLPSKAKQELEMLLMGEGFMNSVGLMQPNWRSILQNSLQHRNMQLRDRIAKVQKLASMSNAEIAAIENAKRREQNEMRARMEANEAARAAARAEANAAAAATLNKNAVLASYNSNLGMKRMTPEEISAAAAPTRSWYNPLGYLGYGGKKTRKHRKAHKKSRKGKSRKH